MSPRAQRLCETADRQLAETGRAPVERGRGRSLLEILLARLASARDALARIAQLTDAQLDAVPPAGAMKFADGDRTLDQIIATLLKHQGHQVDAIAAGLS